MQNKPHSARNIFSADTPLAQVKLGELPAWLGRRSKNPVDWARATSRAYWRFAHKYYYPKNSGLTPIIQMGAGLIVFFYCMNYNKFSKLEDPFQGCSWLPCLQLSSSL